VGPEGQALARCLSEFGIRLRKNEEKEAGKWLREYGLETIREAAEQAGLRGRPNWGYVRGILTNWAREGKPAVPAAGSGLSGSQRERETRRQAERDRIREENVRNMKALRAMLREMEKE